jgi:hypothetical protein
MDNQPDALIDAAKEASRNGPGWRRRLKEGLARLEKLNPPAASFLANAL